MRRRRRHGTRGRRRSRRRSRRWVTLDGSGSGRRHRERRKNERMAPARCGAAARAADAIKDQRRWNGEPERGARERFGEMMLRRLLCERDACVDVLSCVSMCVTRLV